MLKRRLTHRKFLKHRRHRNFFLEFKTFFRVPRPPPPTGIFWYLYESQRGMWKSKKLLNYPLKKISALEQWQSRIFNFLGSFGKTRLQFFLNFLKPQNGAFLKSGLKHQKVIFHQAWKNWKTGTSWSVVILELRNQA